LNFKIGSNNTFRKFYRSAYIFDKKCRYIKEFNIFLFVLKICEKGLGENMLKKSLITVITLLTTVLLVACGSLQKYQISGSEDVQESEWMTEKGFPPEGFTDEEFTDEGREYVRAKGTGVKGVEDDESKVLFNDVLFDYDRYTIREDFRPVLNTAAYFLNENRELKVTIEGHTDERGTTEYNLALGERRAQSTRDYLISLGVSPARITITTLGEERPLCSYQDESCWQRNRRAAFKDSLSY
jgi:peptidoglycan-associated lipoprotein